MGTEAVSAGIDQMIAEGRADRQLEIVREHWSAVRRLWLGDPEIRAVAKFRSDLAPDFWIGCGMPGLADIRPIRDGRFEFTDNGRPAIIVPAYDCIPGMLNANPERHVEHLVDLVAVDVDHPDRFWRRRGEAVVLGNAYLEIAGETRAPVPVFSTPISWFRSGGAGIVILDWDYARDLLLDHDLIAEDIGLGNRLAAVLKPEIWIMAEAA